MTNTLLHKNIDECRNVVFQVKTFFWFIYLSVNLATRPVEFSHLPFRTKLFLSMLRQWGYLLDSGADKYLIVVSVMSFASAT